MGDSDVREEDDTAIESEAIEAEAAALTEFVRESLAGSVPRGDEDENREAVALDSAESDAARESDGEGETSADADAHAEAVRRGEADTDAASERVAKLDADEDAVGDRRRAPKTAAMLPGPAVLGAARRISVKPGGSTIMDETHV